MSTENTNAETLREAAALMRKRAEIGAPNDSPSPWVASLDDHDLNTYEVLCHDDQSGLLTDGLDREVADYIASWHPAVALAVADWLETAARGIDPDRMSLTEGGPFIQSALTVAHAYLGGEK